MHLSGWCFWFNKLLVAQALFSQGQAALSPVTNTTRPTNHIRQARLMVGKGSFVFRLKEREGVGRRNGGDGEEE